MAIDPTKINLTPAPGTIIGVNAKPTPAPAIVPSTDPSAKLNLGGVGMPAAPGITNTNLVPAGLSIPASMRLPVAPVTPTAIPAPTPVKTLTSASTTPTTPPPPVPAATTPQTASTSLGSALSSYSAGLAHESTTLTEQQKQQQNATGAGTTPTGTGTTPAGTGTGNSLSDILRNILTLNGKLGTKSDRTNEIDNEYGIDAKAQLAQKLTNDYAAREKFYDDKINKAQTQNPDGKNATAIQDQVTELTRQKNSELADIAIQQSAAAGNLKVANDLATKKIDAEFEPVQAQIDNLKSYYTLAQNDLSESEKMDAQAAITEKQNALDEEKQKRLAVYKQQIEESSPLYQAQVANERRLANSGGSGSGGTAAERAASTLADYAAAFVPGAKIKATGTPILDENGFITPEAWKAAINSAPAEGLTREEFIKAFGAQVYSDPKTGNVSASYGLTPVEQKFITGGLPDNGS